MTVGRDRQTVTVTVTVGGSPVEVGEEPPQNNESSPALPLIKQFAMVNCARPWRIRIIEVVEERRGARKIDRGSRHE